MDIIVLGLRGIPGIQGGVETHAENLFPLLARAGCRVTVLGRSPYRPTGLGDYWRGVRVKWIWTPRVQSLEAPVHALLGVLYAAVLRPDLLHLHALGAGLMAPLARMLGLRVVFTHHGADYQRQKWGWLARAVLRAGEALAVRSAHRTILVSRALEQTIPPAYRQAVTAIPNGVRRPQLPRTTLALQRFGLTRERYVLSVGRLVPEKRHIDLIYAFERASLSGWHLVIAGGADHKNRCETELQHLARERPWLVLTGIQTGLALDELYANAGVFVLPSSLEGLPIALLEALSFGLPALASDIPANREVELPDTAYFPVGDISRLSTLLRACATTPVPAATKADLRQKVVNRFDWGHIAQKTLTVYAGAI